MPSTSVGTSALIEVDGERLAPAVEQRILRVVITSDVCAPGSCRIEIADPTRAVLADTRVDFVSELTVKAGRLGEEPTDALFKGKAYSLTYMYGEDGATAVITAYDRLYGLFNGCHTKTYRDTSDSDVARAIARELDLDTAEIESSPIHHEYLAQINETHWDFLTARAREVNFEMRVVGDKFRFAKPTRATEAPEPGDYESREREQLVPGATLTEFWSRVSAGQQVIEVEVRGWDTENKQAITSTAQASTLAAELGVAPDELARKLGEPRRSVVHRPFATQAECDAFAEAAAERLASRFVHAEGTTRGDPRLQPGVAVSVGEVTAPFKGKYTVSHVRHEFGPSGYVTDFVANGGHDASLLGEPGLVPAGNPIAGVVVGIVTNTSDPDGRGRVKLKFPWLSDDFESDWARVAHLGAGKDRGFVILPEVNDEVLVVFEHGDRRRPYVLAGLFNGVDASPYDVVDSSDGAVNRRALKTRVGHELIFDDERGKEQIALHSADGNVSVVLDQANGEVRLKAKQNIVIETDGTVKVNTRDFTVEANGRVSISGQTGVEIKSSGDVSIQGTTVRMN
jgi:phage protein D/phage baseplate assembly protein gpV